jgi:hypothetical protein
MQIDEVVVGAWVATGESHREAVVGTLASHCVFRGAPGARAKDPISQGALDTAPLDSGGKFLRGS